MRDILIFLKKYGGENDSISNFKSYAVSEIENISFWEDFVDNEEYRKRLSSYKVYISPSIRQTGLGAIYNSVSLGLKLYLDGVNYEWLNELGFIVHNISELRNNSIDDVLYFDENEKIHNIEKAKVVFDNSKQAKEWETVFGALLNNEPEK